jgi:mRNA interferase MazF
VVAVMKRGEIWVGNLNPSRGREIGKIRPVLIIQSDKLGEDITPMVVILPLSTQVYPAFKRWRVTIPARGRLLKPCQVVIDQPRALDRARFGEGPLATLTQEEMAAVEKSLLGVMGML